MARASIRDAGRWLPGARKTRKFAPLAFEAGASDDPVANTDADADTPVPQAGDPALLLKHLWPRPDFAADARSGVHSVQHALNFMLHYETLPPEPNRHAGPSGETRAAAYVAIVTMLRAAYERGESFDTDTLARRAQQSVASLFSDGVHLHYRVAAACRWRGHNKWLLERSLSAQVRAEFLPELGWPTDPRVRDTDAIGVRKTRVRFIRDGQPERIEDRWYAIHAKRNKEHSFFGSSITREEAACTALAAYQALLKRREAGLPEDAPRVPPPMRPLLGRSFHRVGEDWRAGQQITSEKLMETAGFRGIEFGNWVGQTRRQELLNGAYEACRDLCALIGLPDSAASLGGRLGIAFGSRGRGFTMKGAIAHFEPSTNVIHFTRDYGAGALAHEFGHALDYMLYRQNWSTVTRFNDPCLSSVGCRWNAAKDGVVVANRPLIDRALEAPFLALMGAMRSDGDGFTRYYRNALELDAKRRTEYWSDPAELFARGFETWVSDTLQARGHTSEFLVSGVDRDSTPEAWGTTCDAYPRGDERARIVTAFGEFLAAVAAHWEQISGRDWTEDRWREHFHAEESPTPVETTPEPEPA